MSQLSQASTDDQLLSLVLLLLASQQQTDQSESGEVSTDDLEDIGESILRASFSVLCVGPRSARKMKSQYVKNPSLADDHRARFALIACGYYASNPGKPIASILNNARRQFWRSLNSESGVNRAGEVKVLKTSDYVDCCSPQSLRSAADIADGFPSAQQWVLERGRFGGVCADGVPIGATAVNVLDFIEAGEVIDFCFSRMRPVARRYSDGLFHPDQLHAIQYRTDFTQFASSGAARNSFD